MTRGGTDRGHEALGRDHSLELRDGRRLEYWDGGDPAGRPVIHHPGTPVTRLLGRWAHAAAVEAGVRLIVLNRPGYGGSTPIPATRGLRDVAGDTAELAARLGLEACAVTGSSGGGPYAVATAIAAPDAVRAIGLMGGVGPWRELEAPEFSPKDRECLALADAGDRQAAYDCLLQDEVELRRGEDPATSAASILGDEQSAVAIDPAYRALWTENMRIVNAQPAGYTFDNVAWGAAWDIDVRDAGAPAFLLYGSEDRHCSPDRHGAWYRERLARSQTAILPGAAHIEVIDGHWPEALAGVLRAWEGR